MHLERRASHALAGTSCSGHAGLPRPAAPRFRSHASRSGRLIAHAEALDAEPANGAGAGAVGRGTQSSSERGREEAVKTRFIAETLLPTRHGKFRLRGYKHSVRGLLAAASCGV